VVAPCPAGEGLVTRSVYVATAQVAMLRYILEAHEGLCFMHSDGSGTVTLLAPRSQESAMLALIDDLVRDEIVALTR
jgi:hypothetical protein